MLSRIHISKHICTPRTVCGLYGTVCPYGYYTINHNKLSLIQLLKVIKQSKELYPERSYDFKNGGSMLFNYHAWSEHSTRVYTLGTLIRREFKAVV